MITGKKRGARFTVAPQVYGGTMFKMITKKARIANTSCTLLHLVADTFTDALKKACKIGAVSTFRWVA